MMYSRSQRGQATVELAISMLVLTMLVFLLLQVGLVARDQVLVTQAAREGARAAAVDPGPGVAAAAATRATDLLPARMTTTSSPQPGGWVTVSVRYRSQIRFPTPGRVLLEPELRSKASMRLEG